MTLNDVYIFSMTVHLKCYGCFSIYVLFLCLQDYKNKYVCIPGRTYILTCRSYVYSPCDFTNFASLARRVARVLTEL